MTNRELIDISRIVTSDGYDEWTESIVRCEDCRHRDPEDHRCDCGAIERIGCRLPVDDNYFCAYGENK